MSSPKEERWRKSCGSRQKDQVTHAMVTQSREGEAPAEPLRRQAASFRLFFARNAVTLGSHGSAGASPSRSLALPIPRLPSRQGSPLHELVNVPDLDTCLGHKSLSGQELQQNCKKCIVDYCYLAIAGINYTAKSLFIS
jgi:hypothetical protein